MKKLSVIVSLLCPLLVAAQHYTHADSLRGSLRPERTCFDVNYYDLNLEVDIEDKSIRGYNVITATCVEPTSRIQLDLFENLRITSVTGAEGNPLNFTRDGAAFFVDFPIPVEKGQKFSVTVNYEGKPISAKNPPWDGGFVWRKDALGNPWVGVACEGIGASLWWPNKDHLSDEPDSMSISVTVPSDLVAVCNGNLRNEEKNGSKTTWHWFVSYPINNYNVTLNIGRYVHFHDEYQGLEGPFDLDYYVLPDNLEKAKKHFEQVKPMFDCYEKMLGPYPFPKDGYALVETFYLGMEHQGAIAYGNKYLQGYSGFDFSLLGLPFDYIIIHETGHEYWGNSVSMEDVADMWIHEGFCTYSEVVYVECLYGPETALKYANSWKYRLANDKPVIGDYGVNNEGSGDMYYKGALTLHTLRWLVNDDEKWWNVLRGIQRDFRFKTTNTDELVKYMNEKLGADYTWFFDEYLKKKNPPKLILNLVEKGNKLRVNYRWSSATSESFRLPVTLKAGDTVMVVHPGTQKQEVEFKNVPADQFSVDEMHALFTISYEK